MNIREYSISKLLPLHERAGRRVNYIRIRGDINMNKLPFIRINDATPIYNISDSPTYFRGNRPIPLELLKLRGEINIIHLTSDGRYYARTYKE